MDVDGMKSRTSDVEIGGQETLLSVFMREAGGHIAQSCKAWAYGRKSWTLGEYGGASFMFSTCALLSKVPNSDGGFVS